MKKSSWKTLSQEVVYKNKWYQVRSDKVIRPDGTSGQFNVVETRCNAVAIVAMNAKKQICLIRQYRYATAVWSWELPSGGTDNQPSLQAAKRELQEETGYVAKIWKRVGRLQSMNGVSSEWVTTYLARDLKLVGNTKQSEEGIDKVRWCSFKEMDQLIRTGEITDTQTITEYTQARLYLAKNN
jgi:8-oxo-dGTP pyrophosphatase MutT (NUDIX family)